MSKFNYLPLVMAVSLVVPIQAFSQSTSGQTTSTQSASQPSSSGSATGTSDHGPRTAGTAAKQKTEGEITDVGPGSKAYNGNSLRPKY